MIPFSPPRIDEKTIEAVSAVLRSGWITTGPKTRELEKRITEYCASQRTLCLNSWTNAAELLLRWYGVGPGDEVILPAYTYAATANIVFHLGARPILVDSPSDHFNIKAFDVAQLINSRTKAIMPVDIGGLPCDYDDFIAIAQEYSNVFQPANEQQEKLGRILLLSDSAHSFGATYRQQKIGNQLDVHGFSFHAVKNLTTAEGGALTFNFDPAEKNDELWKALNVSALHGQTKDALSKSKAGEWRYDIVEPGYKCNMTDIHAAIGLVELDRYDVETLPRRKQICNLYHQAFIDQSWYEAPMFKDESKESSYHLFMLRIKGITEQQRDEIIMKIAADEVSVNVHFQPLPLLSFYKKNGFDIRNFPNAHQHYSREISLPVYYDLNDDNVNTVIQAVITATNKVL